MYSTADTKMKTQSFTYGKSLKQPAQQASQDSLSPDRSERKSAYGGAGGNQYANANRRRFRRKTLDKDIDFDPRNYMGVSHEFTLEDINDLKDVFDYYDSTQMGVLLPNDIKLFLQDNGFEPNKKTVYEIVAEFDVDETGGMSFKDFMKAMASKPIANETRKEIATIFKKYDRTGKGHIDLNDLRDINRHVKENLDEETLLMMLKHAAPTNSDKISFEDFYKVMVRPYNPTTS